MVSPSIVSNVMEIGFGKGSGTSSADSSDGAEDSSGLSCEILRESVTDFDFRG